MASDTLNRTTLLVGLSAITAAIGADSQVRLFTDGPSVEETSPTPGMFTDPEGTWYDPEDEAFPVATYGDPYVNDDGEIEVTCESVQFNFIEAEDNESVEIQGWYVLKADGLTVYSFGYLREGKQLATNLDAVIVQPRISLPVPVGLAQ